ncbi:MAG: di-heme oxidoredictase family protein [Thermoanaerobaculia bacterium]
MGDVRQRRVAVVLGLVLILSFALVAGATQIGREVAIPRHLKDGEEYTMPLQDLLEYGKRLFNANWTIQEGGGRPMSKGTGQVLADPTRPLVFPRNFNRISGPDSNSCAGCHNSPYGIPGGNGDIVANVFVLGQRMDFATFDPEDQVATGGGRDERGKLIDFNSVANSRATLGMFGSGYIEMLARQMTKDLQAIRDTIRPGQSKALVSKGIAFGTLSRQANGYWDISRVEGLAFPSTFTEEGYVAPSLVIRPFHQAGAVISIRQFTNTALNHHHGIQSDERFGVDARQNIAEHFRPDHDDGDGVAHEATRADVTALSLYQAAMAVPGRVIPRDPEIEAAAQNGERVFAKIGCTTCHVPALPLGNDGWLYSEPGPYNPFGNLKMGQARTFMMNLNSRLLPLPRLQEHDGVTMVPAFTDLKLHDITSGPDDPNREILDMQHVKDSEMLFDEKGFFAGNGKFLTRKLWGAGNKPNYYHHGKFTTMRESVLAHAGEAQATTDRFKALSDYDKDSLIEFLKTLQVLPPGTDALVVDENFRPR